MLHVDAAPCAELVPLPRRDLTPLRTMLLDHRQSRLDQIQGLSQYAGPRDQRLDTATRRRMLLAARAALDEVEAALHRCDEGSYGWCAGCLSTIPTSHLMAYPQMRYCLRCTSAT